VEARTQMKLFTGGMAKEHRQSLIQLQCAGTEYDEPSPYANAGLFSDDFAPWVGVASHALNPSQLQALGKAVGSDGNLWVALPDNSVQELNLNATGVLHYDAWATPTKYELTLTANSIDLSQTTPEFCVGQEVNLQATWNPSLPGGTQSSYQWALAMDCLDSWLPPSTTNGSSYPYIDPTLLTNSSANIWWYSGGYKFNGCLTTNVFSNGQKLTFITEGDVSIYKPQVYFVAGSPAYPMLYNDYMELGDENLQQGNMTFDAEVISKTNFPGTANWTQLNNRTASYPNAGQDTDGQFWLDTSQFYNNSTNFPPTDVRPYKGTVKFQDAPGVSDVYGFENITDSFQTYLVFKPDDDSAGSSIWVTFGIVTWGWSAAESRWSLTTTNVTPATYSDSDAFPQWLYVGTGHHN
jgi:hypothetical protein